MGGRFSPISTLLSLVTSSAFKDAPQLSFRCRDPKQYLPNFLKMLLLALTQIYTRIFLFWKTIDLHNVWVGHSCPYQLSFLQLVSARLEMRHTHVLGAVTSKMLTKLFQDATFRPLPNLHTCISLVEVYRFEQCLGERFWLLLIFFSDVSSRALRVAPHSSFRCRDLNQCLTNF